MHPTTLSVWGDTNWLLKPLVLQSPFGILFSIATTGHILYTLFTVTTSGTWWPCMSAGVKSNSQPSCEARASGFQAHLWTQHSYVLVPEAVSHPFPPFPPRLSCFLLWEVLASPIFETDAPTPPGGQGLKLHAVTHVLSVVPMKNLAVHL